MSQKAEYKSSIRSKIMIKDAFLCLLDENKSIENITIAEIVTKADLNRGTFYAHYDSIFDLLEEIENQFLAQLLIIFQQYRSKPIKNNTPAIFDCISTFLEENADFYKKLTKANDSNYFLTRLKKLVTEEILQYDELFGEINIKDKIIYVDFFMSGAIGLYQEWLSGKLDISINQLTKKINELLLKVFV